MWSQCQPHRPTSHEGPTAPRPRLPSPAGVTVLHCERHEQAAEFVLACAQCNEGEGAAAAAQLSEGEMQEVVEGVAAHLAVLWGVEKHAVRMCAPLAAPVSHGHSCGSAAQVDFLLANMPLSKLARVRTHEDWQHLMQETHGLLSPELLSAAIEWLVHDRM